jgi:uroporphyrinogen III methyltransferase/synthase
VTVYLVGAGPGDPKLITVRGAELLGRADAVVHDRLIDPRLLSLVPAGAELLDVGKRPGDAGSVGQEAVNALLVELGHRHQAVVRLKGGDPFVFGRGGEEALAMRGAGIDFEVVAGVSSATGALACGGVPVTHRGVAASFTVVTGHAVGGEPPAVDWEALARVGGTLVVLMGVAHRAEIADRLIAAGRRPETPVAVIERGSIAAQRTLRTTLGLLATAQVASPATIVVGEVAALDLGWFETRPLFGWRVIVTRARAQASGLVERLADAGAWPVELPVIAVADAADAGAALARAMSRIGSYEWVAFTSANAVERCWRYLRDARALGRAKVAAIGDGTAAALSVRGVVADLLPERFVAESLVAAFPDPARPGASSVLLPCAADAREVLADGLRTKGWQVDAVEAYRTVRPAPGEDDAEALAGADAVTFTSSSTVKGFLELAGPERVPAVVACIGPVTAGTARQAGIRVDVVAPVHTADGLVDALVAWARHKSAADAGR